MDTSFRFDASSSLPEKLIVPEIPDYYFEIPCASITLKDSNGNCVGRFHYEPKNQDTIQPADNNVEIYINALREECILAKTFITMWKTDNATSRPGIGFWEGLVCARIDSRKNFAKDFFLPTVVNRASKVNNLALRFFACLFAVVIDIASFPLRLLISPIQAIYQSRHPGVRLPLPLEEGLRSNLEDWMFTEREKAAIGVALEDGFVTVEYALHTCEVKENPNGDSGIYVKERSTLTVAQIAFKRLPGYNTSESTEFEYKVSHSLANNTWSLVSDTYPDKDSKEGNRFCEAMGWHN